MRSRHFSMILRGTQIELSPATRPLRSQKQRRRRETVAASSDFVTRGEFHETIDVVRGDIRALGVRFERLESYMRGVAEALTMTREQLERKMDEMEARLTVRISVLEEVVQQNSIDIRKNSEDIRKLQLEVAAMRSDLARREKLQELEVRVTSVEERLGIAK